MSHPFTHRRSDERVEDGVEPAPKFDERGPITCITRHDADGEARMLA